MKDKKFLSFWMEKEKREIIENYAECVYDREVLLERIEKAIEYIEKETKELYSKNRCCKYLGEIMQLEYVLNILNGRRDE